MRSATFVYVAAGAIAFGTLLLTIGTGMAADAAAGRGGAGASEEAINVVTIGHLVLRLGFVLLGGGLIARGVQAELTADRMALLLGGALVLVGLAVAIS